ncbi:MAG: hypothetical protein U0521_15330 [Anaerolineae bacterium]
MRRLVAAEPEAYFTDQYNNPANWRRRIENDRSKSGGRRTARSHFVAGLGTSGTLMGTGRR